MKITRTVLLFVVGMLLFSTMTCLAEAPAEPAKAPDAPAADKAVEPAKVEDPTGKIFASKDKEWLVGKADIDWNATQEWIKGLGEGWRLPTKDELQALFAELGQKSPVGQDFVWAEKKDEHSAWHFSFYYREVRWGYFDDHSRYGRGVAVREKK